VPQTYEKLVFTQVSHRDIVHHNPTEFAAKEKPCSCGHLA
jgi:hypothetical protein